MGTIFDLITVSNNIGTAGNDSISVTSPDVATWGKQGNDTFTSKSKQSPVFLVGGSGNDTYILDGLSSAVVAEYGTQDSSTDTIILRNIPNIMDPWYATIIDGRHLLLYIGEVADDNMDCLILDFFSNSNGIEFIDFQSGGGGLIGKYSGDNLISYIVSEGAPRQSWTEADQYDLTLFLAKHSIPEATINDTIALLKASPDTPIIASYNQSPTYSLTPSAASINEGGTVTTSISTTGVTSGTTLYYGLSGTGITTADFSSGALTGSGTVGTDGKLSISHTLANDLTTEGAETLSIKLYSDSARTLQVGSTATVSVVDYSTTPAPTYTLTPSTSSINEGAVLTSTVTTTNVETGTKLYYTLSGTGITTADFSAGALTGEGVTDATGKFTFTHTIANDLTTEGTETLSIELYSDSARTLQVGSTASVSISDTSKAYVYSIQTSASLINEGSIIMASVRTDPANVGTFINWRLSGEGIDVFDFSEGTLSGQSLIDNSGTATIRVKIANDVTTEGVSGLEKAVIEVTSTGQASIKLAEGSFYIKDTTYKLAEVLTNAWTIEAQNLFNSWASGNGGKTPFIVKQDSILLGGSNSSYLPIIKRIDSSSGVTSETRVKISEYLGKNIIGDISYIAETETPNELIVGGYTNAPITSGGGSDNAFIAKIVSSGEVIWLNGYAITNDLEALIDAETRAEGVYALFRSTRARNSKSIVSRYDPKTGITAWTREIIGIPKDIVVYDKDIYALYWDAEKGSKIYRIDTDSGQILATQTLNSYAGKISAGKDGLLITGSDAIYIANRELTQISDRTWKEALPLSAEFLDVNTYTLSTGEAIATYAINKDRFILASLNNKSVSYNIFDFEEDIVGITGFATSSEKPNVLTTGKVTSFDVASNKLNEKPTGNPTLSGTLKSGQVITIDRTPIQDADNFTGYTPTYSYSFEVSNDNGTTWTKLTSADATDNNTTYTLTTAEVGKQVRGVVSYLDGYGTNEVVPTNGSASITDPSPTYTLTPSATSVNEGSSITYTLTTTNDATGTSLYYQFSGTGINAADFSSATTAGSEVVGSIGQLTITRTLTADKTTEGNETLNLEVFTDSAATTPLATNTAVTVNDTSLTPSTPTQKVYTEKSEISYKPTGVAALPLLYTTSSNDANLSGLTLNVHYNSSILTPSGANNGVSAQVPAAITTTTILPDTSNTDGDQLTDKIVQLLWATFDNSFPNKTLPTAIATVSFDTSATNKDPVTGQSLSTIVRYTAAEAAPNYDFLTGSTTFKAQQFNLDVDGDGKVTALGDGLMVIRKLFGAAFSGDALTAKARSVSATRTTSEIHDIIQQGIDSGMLDVDKDGKTTALGDGLMVIRHLFGAAFAGAALTNKAISPDSPYFGPPANFAAVAANIDAMRPV